MCTFVRQRYLVIGWCSLHVNASFVLTDKMYTVPLREMLLLSFTTQPYRLGMEA